MSPVLSNEEAGVLLPELLNDCGMSPFLLTRGTNGTDQTIHEKEDRPRCSRQASSPYQNAIELGCHEGQAWLIHSLSEYLVLHLQMRRTHSKEAIRMWMRGSGNDARDRVTMNNLLALGIEKVNETTCSGGDNS